ncbi:DsbA family oxidoreductase [Defluviimonas sp. WL0002]|uniref:DsbA family oxidoreductase n=1 Tax=Albidovulum marisflavi TaxID=2984159 RepID=A0ABT2ZFR5_9RHOB|nr:DsbA family oxidoreductase [Defluviimonas sp. WL0002]MCV2869970.1 DsbA family oxidoreductase [Defluviimonas sp. WL0002]
MIKLDILSDPVCPWCYIGKARLDRALEARPSHPFAIEWHPFQLNPDMPPEGMDRRKYLEWKFGGKEGAVSAHVPIMEHAADAGVELNLEKITRSPNTLDAHRLIHWAGLEGRQTPMVSALFRAYFREGRDVGDADTLAAIAESVGLDRAMIERLLASDADREEIMARDAHARERGVNAVPTFLIANTYVLSGAQPAETWMQIIDELVEKTKDTQS